MSGFYEVSGLLAAASMEVSENYPTLPEALWSIFLSIVLLLANAFFVASEFAIVKVRPSQVEAAGKLKGKAYATAEKVVGNLDGYLSANQLGITLASLSLGFVAEPFVASLVAPTLNSITWFPKDFIGITSFIVALVSFTFLHVVVGELLPKSVAIRKPLESTLILAKPLSWFYTSTWFAIYFLQGTSNKLLKWIFRLDPADESEVHSSEELALLVRESGDSEEVTKTERQILINALELNDLTVKEVMLPRSEAMALDMEKSFEDNLALAVRTKHTRFPLVRGHFDNTVGLIHIKDMLKVVRDEAPDLMKIRRELKVVPETMPLDGLLEFFLKERAHLAMVVDEYGDAAGLIFMDNVMEELVGDIQDEFDNEEAGYTKVNESEFVVEGSFSVYELENILEGFDLDVNEVTTIGGYITQQLERLPEPGETLLIDNYEAKVTSTDGRRVGQVHLRRLSEMEVAEMKLVEE